MENFGLGAIGEKIARQALQATTEHHEAVASDVRHKLIENTVTKSNFLARAKHGFSLVELRVMEMFISKLNPVSMQLNIYQTVDMRLSALEYAEASNITEKSAYRELERTVDALQTKIIETREDDGKGRLKRVKRPLMFKAEYVDKEGYVDASFHPEFIPHLIGLREQFTKYALADVLKFKSEYTWRIYEMCMSVKSSKNGVLGISVDNFRERLAMPTGYVWSNVDRIIKKAQLEIKTKTKYELDVSYKKTSRKITWLEFSLSKKAQTELAV